MSTSTPSPQSFKLPGECWMYDYDYTGPSPGYNDSAFSICAQFDCGSERYFSGFRIVLLCKKDEKELAGLTVDIDRGLCGSYALDPGMSIRGTSRAVEDPQSAESAGDRPCTVVYEIVDQSDDTWYAADLQLRPPQLADDDAYRIVHEYKQLCTSAPSSTSVMLFLLASCSFRGQLKPDNPLGEICDVSAPIGVVARGVRILPPPALHPPFKQPPPEILQLIFLQPLEDMMYDPWRRSIFSFALVCRAWAPAFALLYQDFSEYAKGRSPPSQLDVGAALRVNPEYGRSIRRLSPYHFRDGKETNMDVSQALVDIVSSAVGVEDLTIKDVFVELKDKFIQALCGCTMLKAFKANRGPPDPENEPSTYVLSLADIITCMVNWRSLRIMEIYAFSPSVNFDRHCPKPACQLEQVRLQGGRASDIELMYIMSASFSSIQKVDFANVTGITNSGLKEWLSAVSGSLRGLTFQDCTFPRANDDEEYAIDAVVGKMDQLQTLQLDGDMYTDLVFMRKEKRPRVPGRARASISLHNIRPGTLTRHFLLVLTYTGWQNITLWGAFHGEPELKEEAKKVASEHEVTLMMVW
ncbi:hypothetical protein DENSPDRAFT_871931 [Dentipellis sp. KUC8613]|nr:hypothetical protein DENSPDRAFT_871931 [Dentipellis sp. KUC8613]